MKSKIIRRDQKSQIQYLTTNLQGDKKKGEEVQDQVPTTMMDKRARGVRSLTQIEVNYQVLF